MKIIQKIESMMKFVKNNMNILDNKRNNFNNNVFNTIETQILQQKDKLQE